MSIIYYILCPGNISILISIEEREVTIPLGIGGFPSSSKLMQIHVYHPLTYFFSPSKFLKIND